MGPDGGGHTYQILRVVERLFWHGTASLGGGNQSLDGSLEASLETSAEGDLVLLLHPKDEVWAECGLL